MLYIKLKGTKNMNISKLLKEYPIIIIISFVALILSIYQLTVGSAKDVQYNALKDKVVSLEFAKQTLSNNLDNAVSKNDLFKMAKEVADTVVNQYSSELSKDYKLKSKTYRNNNIVTSDFYLEHKVEFPQGDYLLEEAYKSSKLIEAMVSYVILINKIYKDEGITKSYKFEALFEGSADGNNLGGKNVGKYNGEYGIIQTKNVIINGEKVDISLYPNDNLDNIKLDFLRSYSVYKSFREYAKDLPGQIFDSEIKFIAQESENKGKEYRYAKIIVNIPDMLNQ